MEKPQQSLRNTIFSLFGFVLFWVLLTDAWGYSERLLPIFHNGWNQYLYGYFSRIIWVLPALGFMVHYGDHKLKTIFSKPKLNRSLTLFLLFMLIYCICAMFIIHHGIWINPSVSLLGILIKFIIVGFVEEIVFRGWGYTALRQKISEKNAVILSTLVFVILHWPAYFIRLGLYHSFDFLGLISQSIVVFLLGMIFCHLLKKSNSLLNPIIAHASYDFFVTLLIG